MMGKMDVKCAVSFFTKHLQNVGLYLVYNMSRETYDHATESIHISSGR